MRRHAEAERFPDAEPGALLRAQWLRDAAVRLEASVDARLVRRALELGLAFLDDHADRILARAGDDRILAHARLLAPEDVRPGKDGGDDAFTIAPPDGPEGAADDVALELAGLSTALVAADKNSLAERLVSHYAGEAEDFSLYGVLGFHETVAALRSGVERLARAEANERTAAVSAVERTLHALAEARRPPAAPAVIALSGAIASGKSTLALGLADALGLPRTVADRIRDHLVHGVPGRPVHEAGWAEGHEPGFGPKVYAELLARGEAVLGSGRGIVLDAGFPTPRERAAARALARRFGVPFRFVACRVDRDTQLERLAARDDTNGSPGEWRRLAEAYAERYVEPEELPAQERIEVDTTRGEERALRDLLDALEGSGLPLAL